MVDVAMTLHVVQPASLGDHLKNAGFAMALNDVNSHPTDIHVGRRLMERRLALGHNQSDLARALGLTFQQIQKYEKGANRVSASKLWDAAQFLQVDVGYFFQGLGDSASRDQQAPAEPSPPPTRYSLDIAKLVPSLTGERQRMILQLIQELI